MYALKARGTWVYYTLTTNHTDGNFLRLRLQGLSCLTFQNKPFCKYCMQVLCTCMQVQHEFSFDIHAMYRSTFLFFSTDQEQFVVMSNSKQHDELIRGYHTYIVNPIALTYYSHFPKLMYQHQNSTPLTKQKRYHKYPLHCVKSTSPQPSNPASIPKPISNHK